MTMTIKTSDLTGAALDWVVSKCEGEPVYFDGVTVRYVPGQFSDEEPYNPSTNWAQGGPIIEREHISLRGPSIAGVNWASFIDKSGTSYGPQYRQVAPTPLIAAMRCYVASKLGDTVEIPAELMP